MLSSLSAWSGATKKPTENICKGKITIKSDWRGLVQPLLLADDGCFGGAAQRTNLPSLLPMLRQLHSPVNIKLILRLKIFGQQQRKTCEIVRL